MTAKERLVEWVAEQHKGQKIKHSGEPYFNHLKRVALLAEPATALCFEIGLCHDLLEDTSVTKKVLHSTLIQLGYKNTQAEVITSCVRELTDVYTAAAYPYLSKSQRKELEATRLAGISAMAQTVKYADLIDNINWVIQYQPDKAIKYLRKKQKLLLAMDSGNIVLRQRLAELIEIRLLKCL